jgi:hypothetical protein
MRGGGDAGGAQLCGDVRAALSAGDTANSLMNLIGTLMLTGGTKKDNIHAAAVLICGTFTGC